MNHRATLSVMAAVMLTATSVSGAAWSAPAARSQASQPAVDPVKLVLVYRYMEAIRLNDLIQGMSRSMVQSMTAGENIPSRWEAALNEALLESMAAVTPSMLQEFAVLYADVFTTEELQALVDFYESPTGRSLTVKSQVLAEKSGEIHARFRLVFEQDFLPRARARIAAIEGDPVDNSAGPPVIMPDRPPIIVTTPQ